ncbi:hypothetical protein [Paenibacillus xylanexedens]|uniref:hypothetical protein n=1 Tax=Paenibacillus xylanexedens TaxID=528191 RepID=UPI000F5279A4|nr:hypothetical protein [Paenibacillus xylanexedens]RPK23994.1 hypothetical protein EDO6_04932 [Paenibacillus xylanexedens]
MNIKVSSATVTSTFTNGFSVDFTLQGDNTVHSGRLYQSFSNKGTYEMALYLTESLRKYTDEPHSEVSNHIADQIVRLIGEIE